MANIIYSVVVLLLCFAALLCAPTVIHWFLKEKDNNHD